MQGALWNGHVSRLCPANAAFSPAFAGILQQMQVFYLQMLLIYLHLQVEHTRSGHSKHSGKDRYLRDSTEEKAQYITVAATTGPGEPGKAFTFNELALSLSTRTELKK
jgi:hypothetical protein